MHHEEDIRIQHYNAKNFHFFEKSPSTRIEWLEVMQHHGVKTRALDWSESSTHSLLFALEPFYGQKGSMEKEELTPCVWVLAPCSLNRDLFGEIKKCTDLQKSILQELDLSKKEEDHILGRIDKFLKQGNMKRDLETDDTHHIDYILNLSAISEDVLKERTRIKRFLMDGGVFNPIYYLLSRIYSDGTLLEDHKLPPLAVVQPYHSERIRAQKGVFTIFPFYNVVSDKQREHLTRLEVNPDSMSYNRIARKHLYKIMLKEPQRIAREILVNGMNESWLYPEIPVVSGEIEHRAVY